ncbi:MAG TPA: MBL fold metallo-hydrolase [Steroidobacteraceae bacterium]|nr:MBL fold metallo-hydrolase [Steroidobacteraceae bacterium]
MTVAAPAPGASVEIAPGVRWARIPLPMELNHINVWLVASGDGCVIVDTGMAVQMGKDAWQAIERETFATQPVRAVFVTHIHPDHSGLAAWLQERYRVPVLMSASTHDMLRQIASAEDRPSPRRVEEFFRSHGLTDVSHVQPLFNPERFGRISSGLPQVERFIGDGDTLQWSGAQWTAVRTDGHAHGHLCLSNAAARVLISGDQVLPSISSNISYGFHVPDANPLRSYLESLQRLRGLATETLVLPSHGVPFHGLQQRIDDLTTHHQEQLVRIEQLCREPKTAAQVLPSMFRRELKGMHLFLALGEALAHLEYLVHAGRLRRSEADGVVRYSPPQ